jgi:hypothetical protein
MNYSFRLVGALAITAAMTVSSAQGAVSSWLSTVGTVGGGTTPGNAVVNINAGESSSLYLWLRNTTTLRSVAYDIQAATAGIVNLTGVEVYAPDLLVGGAVDIGDRWNLPVAAGEVAANGQSITNFGAVNVDKSGLALATRSFDALYDPVADAALIAKINFTGTGGGATAFNLTEGLTKIVEAGNPNAPELTFSGATVNVAGGVDPPVVGDLGGLTDAVSRVITGVVPVTGADTLTFDNASAPTFTPLLPGKPLVLTNLPTIDAQGNFSWDAAGTALRGTYTWALTGQNGSGTDGGSVSVTLSQVPEPATLALVGLVAVGGLGVARRRK